MTVQTRQALLRDAEDYRQRANDLVAEAQRLSDTEPESNIVTWVSPQGRRFAAVRNDGGWDVTEHDQYSWNQVVVLAGSAPILKAGITSMSVLNRA